MILEDFGAFPATSSEAPGRPSEGPGGAGVVPGRRRGAPGGAGVVPGRVEGRPRGSPTAESARSLLSPQVGYVIDTLVDVPYF